MKAVSPIIAIVIIVAVVIGVAIMVSLWLSGLVGMYTRSPSLQVFSNTVKFYDTIYSSINGRWIYFDNTNLTEWDILINYNGNPGWIINITLVNTGSAASSIDELYINRLPATEAKGVIGYKVSTITINPGQQVIILIAVDNSHYTHGQIVKITVELSNGYQYQIPVKLV